MFEGVITYFIQTYGYIGLYFLMIIQTVLVVIPSEAVVVLSGALGLDTVKVIIIGTLGLISGAIIAFSISRYLGRKIVLKIVGQEWIDEIDEWITQHGFTAIMISRIIPLIPFDLISYVAGLTIIDFKLYMIATVIGMIPRMVFLVLLGTTARVVLSWIGLGLDFIVAAGTLGIILIMYLDRKGYLGKIRSKILRKIINIRKGK